MRSARRSNRLQNLLGVKLQRGSSCPEECPEADLLVIVTGWPHTSSSKHSSSRLPRTAAAATSQAPAALLWVPPSLSFLKAPVQRNCDLRRGTRVAGDTVHVTSPSTRLARSSLRGRNRECEGASAQLGVGPYACGCVRYNLCGKRNTERAASHVGPSFLSAVKS